MSGMRMLLIVWGVLTSILVGLVLYRLILGVHEEDQLFLERGEEAMEQEQSNLVLRINRVDPFIRWLGIASGGLILCIGIWWMYVGLFHPPIAE